MGIYRRPYPKEFVRFGLSLGYTAAYTATWYTVGCAAGHYNSFLDIPWIYPRLKLLPESTRIMLYDECGPGDAKFVRGYTGAPTPADCDTYAPFGLAQKVNRRFT